MVIIEFFKEAIKNPANVVVWLFVLGYIINWISKTEFVKKLINNNLDLKKKKENSKLEEDKKFQNEFTAIIQRNITENNINSEFIRALLQNKIDKMFSEFDIINRQLRDLTVCVDDLFNQITPLIKKLSNDRPNLDMDLAIILMSLIEDYYIWVKLDYLRNKIENYENIKERTPKLLKDIYLKFKDFNNSEINILSKFDYCYGDLSVPFKQVNNDDNLNQFINEELMENINQPLNQFLSDIKAMLIFNKNQVIQNIENGEYLKD